MPATIQYTESFTLDGSTVFVRVQHDIAYRPSSFKVNGVQVALKQTFVDVGDHVSWFWTAQSPFVSIDSVVAPINGTTIEITYESLYSNTVGSTSTSTVAEIVGVNDPDPPGPNPDPNPVDSSQNYTPVAPSGIIQRVYDIPGTVGTTAAASLAAGITRRASLIPLAISCTTQHQMPRIGEKVSVELTDYDIDGDFIVSSISAKTRDGVNLGHGTSFETVLELVQLVDAPEQSPADTTPAGSSQTISSAYPIYASQPLENLNTRTAIQPAPLNYERFSIVLGDGGPLVGGIPLGNRYIIFHTGVLKEIYVTAVTPPSAQALQIDVFQDGVSIFGDFGLVIPAGGDGVYGVTKFAGWPGQYRMRRGSLVTFAATYLVGSGTPVAAENVSVFGEWYYN